MVKIGAIVVLYNPDFSVTMKALLSLSRQVDRILVVDNSLSDHTEELRYLLNVEYKPLLKNIGIAAAQNIGVRYFTDLGYDFVLFSDQDSIAPEGVLNQLFDNYQALQNAGINVGAIGTRAINRQSGLPYVEKTNEIRRIEKVVLNSSSDVTECYSIMSSISFISCRSFRRVGGFDESLFIDGVDNEWCWRAWHKCCLRSFIVEDAKISHMLGEGDKRFLCKKVAIASPFRVYYQFRNYLWLCRRDYVPKFWKRKNGIKYLVKLFFFPICVSPRIKYLQCIIQGIKDGLTVR